MSLAITIELGDADLKHFIDAMHVAQQEAKNLPAHEITDAASQLLADGKESKLPSFIAERLSKLDSMISMVNDQGFALPDEDRQRVLGCLAYFANPKDIIPDNVPVLGFLDDAIMIDVVQQVLAPEIEAYADFCKFREQEAQYGSADTAALGREDWLAGRRAELQVRMRQRRSSYAPSASWTPSFRVS
jgi:uncharacterized membrane protein YkvA (DUF1232 family)